MPETPQPEQTDWKIKVCPKCRSDIIDPRMPGTNVGGWHCFRCHANFAEPQTVTVIARDARTFVVDIGTNEEDHIGTVGPFTDPKEAHAFSDEWRERLQIRTATTTLIPPSRATPILEVEEQDARED